MFVNYLLVFLILVDGRRLHTALRQRRFLESTDPSTTLQTTLPPLYSPEDSVENLTFARMDLRTGTIFGVAGMCMCFCCAFFIWSQYEIIERYIKKKTENEWEEDSEEILIKVRDDLQAGLNPRTHPDYQNVDKEKLQRAYTKAMKEMVLLDSAHGPINPMCMSPELPPTPAPMTPLPATSLTEITSDDLLKDPDNQFLTDNRPLFKARVDNLSLAAEISRRVTHPLPASQSLPVQTTLPEQTPQHQKAKRTASDSLVSDGVTFESGTSGTSTIE